MIPATPNAEDTPRRSAPLLLVDVLLGLELEAVLVEPEPEPPVVVLPEPEDPEVLLAGEEPELAVTDG